MREEVYLNKINFRHSGNDYGLISSKACLYWYMDAIGLAIPGSYRICVRNGKKQMQDMGDICHVAEKEYLFFVVA